MNPNFGVALLLRHSYLIECQIITLAKELPSEAFTPTASEGGFAGATVWMAIRYGVARGVFSNEAGLGSAPIAHAAATTRSPVNQAMIGMLGTFIDTIIVYCLQHDRVCDFSH